MPGEDDIKFMGRCLELAIRAKGKTCPNPMVGSVIVHDGLIIGEGYHLKAGEPHAEVIAIKSVRNKRLLESSTLYVNLEPCSHYGKTPPCAEYIISEGITKVVIGTMDTSEKVMGEGIIMLKSAGCEVITGVLEDECRWVNRRFFTYNEKKRPYIILKWAQSADGYIDIDRKENDERQPAWITGKAEKALVHKWRAAEQSILAGAGTVRADNPKLNVRDWTGDDPLRLILSSSGRLDNKSEVFRTNGINIVFTHNIDVKIADTVVMKLNDSNDSAVQISDYLYNSGIQSILVEGGANVFSHFISTGLWDEARIFYGKDYFRKGVKAPVINGKVFCQTKFNLSSLEVILNEGG
ncbi:MAG: bifunctional diaminohydroxyphosphoribosylaminopyrimidine deaminase/5-amino-6-(5-phosphoribosylamino)uracil reductase RibD [Bacteroidia bacterium]|nr:bifunctional diaminohydroxyphosphoribosylaminopyrimidine deaminase/5-amino-6-(5-phosphoribosylamino)uracil reductase RibD [Bacteroidia bacterium]